MPTQSMHHCVGAQHDCDEMRSDTSLRKPLRFLRIWTQANKFQWEPRSGQL